MTTKSCIACGVHKPLHDFYRHPGMRDGHLNKCIECVKSYMHERQKQGKTRAYDNARSQQPHRVEARKVYAKSEAGRQARLRAQKTMRARYPEKNRARYEVAYALQNGRLQRAPCEVCGSADVQAHHDDYSKPLEVRWLCELHHREHHRRMEAA